MEGNAPMPIDYSQGKGRIDRTFTGDAPTGENVRDTEGPGAEPGMDVGASELPTRGDAGFPGSPKETPEDAGKGPVDVGARPPEQSEENRPR